MEFSRIVDRVRLEDPGLSPRKEMVPVDSSAITSLKGLPTPSELHGVPTAAARSCGLVISL